uniref:Uncharacterized protein n=1 Tax=viral metagenome TaxID=1070528 RepID=A0A6M3KYB0_9ZZZZ
MKVTVKSLTDEEFERRDYRDALEIYIDGKVRFSVYDGEPEDANLSRDFNDCWNISELMKTAFLAGKNGEEFEIEILRVDEF